MAPGLPQGQVFEEDPQAAVAMPEHPWLQILNQEDQVQLLHILTADVLQLCLLPSSYPKDVHE